jgi:hypothetical protein
MLFARVDERGRVALVRTGAVSRFERHQSEDPFVEPEPRPSASVATSAPVITPSSPSPRRQRNTIAPPPPREPPRSDAYAASKADPYEDAEASDRTQPIHALRNADFQSMQEPAPRLEPEPDDDDATLDRTTVYKADQRTTWPSAGSTLSPPGLPTLRKPPPLSAPPSDNPYAARARGALPKRGEPYVSKTRSERAPRPPELDHGRNGPSPSEEPVVEPPRSATQVGSSSNSAPRTWKVASRRGIER